ncbi:hypothetical protein BDV35DRAFT_366597 [Aspergillus flavus]|uniref:Uncharacterized protein n=1 Tax=Aspergillus flavus TaxID=5059 RepID=A0A5N6GK83_ASPFL|nr:hypothetical protein BDV35DRAFT_366597 [Aspergillus flavus]
MTQFSGQHQPPRNPSSFLISGIFRRMRIETSARMQVLICTIEKLYGRESSISRPLRIRILVHGTLAWLLLIAGPSSLTFLLILLMQSLSC